MSDAAVCHICGKPAEPGQKLVTAINKATRSIVHVHPACERKS